MKRKMVAVYLLPLCLWFVEAGIAGVLDDRYGVLELPSHIKYYEVDDMDRIMLNPYLQVATEKHKAILNPSKKAYDWVIDANGDVRVIEMAPHPRGRTYSSHFKRPEDGYERDSGYVERYGHVSALAGGPGRIGGEISNDKVSNQWIINNKSGRYSRGIGDRSPEKLMNAAALIRARVDPGGQEWGATLFLLEYGPEQIRDEAIRSGSIRYAFPEEKKIPFIVL